MSDDDVAQLAQGAGIKSITVCDIDRRRQPEFGFATVAAHMDVHGLARVALIRIEEKSVRFVAKHDGRGAISL